MSTQYYFGDLNVKEAFAYDTNTDGIEFFVDPAGSDSNDGLTVGTPFATIQHALDQVSVVNGFKAIINLADGTYNENLTVPSIVTKTPDDYYPAGFGAIFLVGNTVTPANVVIKGDSVVRESTILCQNLSILAIQGATIQSNDLASGVGITINGPSAYLFLDNTNFSSCATGITGSQCTIQIGTDITFDTGNVGISLSTKSSLTIIGTSTFTSFATTGIILDDRCFLLSFGTCFPTSSGAGTGISATQNSVVLTLNFGVGATSFHPTNCAIGLNLSNGSQFQSTGGVNFDNCTQTIVATDYSLVEHISGNYTYTNGTATTIGPVDPGVILSSSTTFNTATVSINDNSNYRYGYDGRYRPTPGGGHSGVLPTGVTRHFAHDAVQSTSFPLYIAERKERVVRIRVLSRVGNGAAHTDTYTVTKNGADTTLSIALTDSASGTSTVNPVSLAAGDWIGVKVVTDAATVGEDVRVQLQIEEN